MKETIQKLFAKFTVPEPKTDLLFTILQRIEKEKSRRLRIGIFVYSFMTLILIGISIWSFYGLQNSLNQSGFVQFFSLLFSDFAVIKNYWQSFTLTLLEALPLTGIIFVFSAFLALILSLNKLVADIKQTFHLKFKLYGHQ